MQPKLKTFLVMLWSRFFGALGGIFAGGVIIFIGAIALLLFGIEIPVPSKEVVVLIGAPFAILGAAFPKYTMRIGQEVLSHWPSS